MIKSYILKITDSKAFLLVSLIILPVFMWTGCSEGGEEGNEETPIATSSRKLFVANSFGNRISVFDADASGNVPPIRSIGSDTRLSNPDGIFVDTKNNEIFVANSGNNTVTVYGRADEGDVAPARTIEGANTRLIFPTAIFVDNKNNEIYVANSNSITVYDITDSGDVNPLRTIDLNPDLFPSGIFVDTNNDEIFLSGSIITGFGIIVEEVGIVQVFNRTAKGNESPKRSLTISELSAEGLPFLPESLFVDVDNDELYLVDFARTLVGFSGSIIGEVIPFPLQKAFESSIKVYRRTDSGNAQPLRTIRGTGTRLFNPADISVDTVDNEIFIANAFDNSISVYRRTDSGNAQPLRTLFISATDNAGVIGNRLSTFGLFVDTDNKEIFVSNLNNTITVYGIKDEGDIPPLRVIGPITDLLFPQWIFVDTRDNEIFVTNSSSRLITVFELTKEGNIPPLNKISQGSLFPMGFFVDKEHNEIFVANVGEVESITVYRITDGIPLRSILGPNTGINFPQGLYVDAVNNEIFVTNLRNDTITIYMQTDEGNVFPVRTIGGGNTKLSGPSGIFVDTKHNEILVTNLDDSITVFKNESDATGDINPLRIIKGFNTGLFFPVDIFLDTENDEIFVTNLFDNSITIYNNDRTKEGVLDVSPVRTIRGSLTELDGPFGIFVSESQ